MVIEEVQLKHQLTDFEMAALARSQSQAFGKLKALEDDIAAIKKDYAGKACSFQRLDYMKITVYGMPAPQGSKRFLGMRGGKGIMVESSKAVKPWREAVKHAALAIMGKESLPVPVIAGSVRVWMYFTLPKPKSAPKNRITYPCRKPDLSKLVRATEDALTDAGVWEDDARVVSCTAEKRYPVEPRGFACERECECEVCFEGSLPIPGAVIIIELFRGRVT